jgi:hypothetical protein
MCASAYVGRVVVAALTTRLVSATLVDAKLANNSGALTVT